MVTRFGLEKKDIGDVGLAIVPGVVPGAVSDEDRTGQTAAWESAGRTMTTRYYMIALLAVEVCRTAPVVVVVVWKRGRTRDRGIEGHKYYPLWFFFFREGREGGGHGVLQG